MSGLVENQINRPAALIDDRVGQIHRGLGVVVRWGELALVIPSDSAHDAVVDRMLQDLGAMPTVRAASQTIDDLLASGRLKSIAFLHGSDDGYSAMAFGSTEILVDGEVVLAGAENATRHELPTTGERITMRASNLAKAAEPVAPYDLRRGIAPGAGLTLRLEKSAVTAPPDSSEPPVEAAATQTSAPPTSDRPEPKPIPVQPREAAPDDSGPQQLGDEDAVPTQGPSPTKNAAPEPAATTGMGAASIPLTGEAFDPNNLLPPLAPLPLPAEQDSTMDLPDTTRSFRLEGIICARNHFNNPANANCMVCGLSLAHLSDERVRGPRPTLGFIVFDDGATFGLNRSYVIGREPQPSSDSDAEALVIRTDNETLSRTHAELRLVDWQVQLIDRGSTNGTYIWNPAAQEWYQLTANMGVELRSGATVALGRRTFVFEGVGHTNP